MKTSNFGRMLILTALLGAAVVPSAQASTYYLAYTDQSGGVNPVKTDNLRFFTFTTTWAWSVGGGDFEMKVGPNTSGNIYLGLFEGTTVTTAYAADGAGLVNDAVAHLADPSLVTPIAMAALTPGDFTQSYAPISFRFTDVALQDQTTYTLALFTANNQNGSDQFFIKDGTNFSFYSSNGDPIPASDPNTSTPEPASMMMVGSGALAAVLVHLRRRK